MSHLRLLIRLLAAPVLLVGATVLAPGPVLGQSETPVKVFVFVNAMVNPDADNDGKDDQRWQVRVTVGTLGSCVPERGDVGYSSLWFDTGDSVGATLSIGECVFSINAQVRNALRPDCRFRAELAWADNNGDVSGDYEEGSVLTAGRPDAASRLSIRRAPGSGCATARETHFVLRGAEIVHDIPGASADPTLTALARQAAEVAAFTVRVEPDYPSGTAPPAGCDRTTDFTVRGDGSRSSQVLQDSSAAACRLRAVIAGAPTYIDVAEGDNVGFDGALPNIIIDLTSLVRLVPARIAIIQDVRGSGNRGTVTYTVSRSCGGVPVASPAATSAGSELYEGRFTVHAPHQPAFGATAIYRAVATSTTSATVAGCSVTATVGNLPQGCTVDGDHSRTLTWSDANPVSRFDFEFGIGCGAAVTASTGGGSSATPEDMVPADDAEAVTGTGSSTGGGGSPVDAGPPLDSPTG